MAVPRATRAAAAVLALAAGPLVACDAQGGTGSPDRSAPHPGDRSGNQSAPHSGDHAATAAPEEHRQRSPLQRLPAMPATGRPAVLAGQLGRVAAVLADPHASEDDVRRAGEFEQLAARQLARAPDAVRRTVLSRLGPALRQKTAGNVEAAALLDGMSAPQTRLPDWRILQPAPPARLLADYRLAARRVGVPWTYLAAINLVETRMGRIRGASTAGALGPMQFLPSTWDLYGEGGDIDDPRDAILAAARLLRANGAPGDMAGALRHYNPSDNYVVAVTRYAEQLRRDPLSYRGYWHWRVLYKHVRGTYLLPVGYPAVGARLLD